FAMISGKLAAETIVEAKSQGDFSAAALSRYRERLESSFILKDLHKIRHMTDFAHRRPHLLNDIPETLSQVAREYLTVDNLPLSTKQKQITRLLRAGLPLRRAVDDALGLVRAIR